MRESWGRAWAASPHSALDGTVAPGRRSVTMEGMTGRVDHPRETLGEVLDALRHRLFVGRAAELDLFAAALDTDDDPHVRVLFVHGPGGVGKSSLLDEFARRAEQLGCCVVRLDGRDLGGGPDSVLDAVGSVLEVPDGDEAILPATGERLVLLVDGYERMAPLDAWVRDRFLPRLPAETLTVIAGRLPPRPAWRADAGWSGLLRVVSLRNLDPDDARLYVERRGVDGPRRAEALAVSHGHPLTLSLSVDVLARDPDADLASLPADLVAGLLRRLVTRVPTPAHRRALEVSAVSRTTTESLLRHVLGGTEDAHVLFRWLAGLSVMELGSHGVVPHDVVRDLLDSDLRWRDPDGYRAVFRAVRSHAMHEVRHTEGREQQTAIADLKFLFRNLRSVLSPVAWDDFGDEHPVPAEAADRDDIIRLVERAEGARSAGLAGHWFDRQPEGFHVLRDPHGSVRGVVGLLDLTAASAEDRDADPGTAAAWAYVEGVAPTRAGDVVTQCRFIVDAEAHEGPSPTLNAVPVITMQRELGTPRLAWDVLTLAEPDRWNEYFAAADLPRAVGADFVIDGRRFGLFAHDFRRVPLEAVTERWTERALADDALLLPAAVVGPELLVLSHPDFGAAVRQAVRDLHRPDLLALNPLLRTRLLVTHDGAAGPDGLAELVRTAAASLAADPRTDKAFRALDRTYLRSSRTQESAAALLGLPFSTYRRHLRHGLEAVVALLWERELGTG